MLYLLLDNTRSWLDRIGLYPYVQVLDQIEFRAIAAALVAFAIVLLGGKRTIRFLVRLKIGDAGVSDSEALRVHAASKANVPTAGGLLIALAIVISHGLFADLQSRPAAWALLVVLWSAGLGATDDYLKLRASRDGTGRQGLYAWEKLVFQLGLGLLTGLFLASQPWDMARVVTLPFQKTYDGAMPNEALLYLAPALFVGWAVILITGMSNAVNITDGMDGLASGISAVVCLGIMLLAIVAGDEVSAKTLLVPWIPGAGEIGVLVGATAGACLGFLWWNCAPAQVFMGDTGALCLGAIIAYAALVTRQEIVVLVMCGVFLFEILSVVLQVGYFKWSGGKRIFECAPVHHHFHIKGWGEQKVVARAWIVTVVLVVLALGSLKLR